MGVGSLGAFSARHRPGGAGGFVVSLTQVLIPAFAGMSGPRLCDHDEAIDRHAFFAAHRGLGEMRDGKAGGAKCFAHVGLRRGRSAASAAVSRRALRASRP